MPRNPSVEDPTDQWAAFACSWRLHGWEAASVRVSGEVDTGTAPELDETLHEALRHARLVLMDLREMSFMDSTGLHVLVNASLRARAQAGHLVLSGVSAQLTSLLDVTGTREHVDLLETHLPDDPRSRAVVAQRRWSPLDNPVNVRVQAARVMEVSETRLWMQATDGTIHRPWAPAGDGLPVPAGSEVELYLDAGGALNGWLDPRSGLAINQRGLAPGESPATHSDLACAGPCKIVWLAPAAARLAERDERCLTCAGPLVLH